MAVAGWLAGHPSILPGAAWVSWARDITARLLQSLRPDPTPVQQGATPHGAIRPPSWLQQASRGLQASGSVVEVEVVSPLPLTSASLLDEEHMSTQYKDTNRTHTF